MQLNNIHYIFEAVCFQTVHLQERDSLLNHLNALSEIESTNQKSRLDYQWFFFEILSNFHQEKQYEL